MPEAAAVQPAPAPASVPAPKPVVPKPVVAPKPSLLEQITANPVYLGGGAAALLLVVAGGLFLKRRRQAEEDDSSSDDFTLDGGDTFQFAPVDSDTTVIDDEAIADEIDQPAESAAASSDVEAETKSVRPETGDAIAESDIYIAYGRYQQAVDLLSTAIDSEPKRSDLRVKLLEVYVEMRNREAFRQQFAELQQLGDSNAVAQVKDMLSSVDGVSDWLDNPSGGAAPAFVAGAGVAAAAAATATAFAADELPMDTASSSESSTAELGSDLELDLDLDGDLDLEGELEGESAASDALALDGDFEFSPEPAATSGADLEFNLDLDADTAASTSQELSDLTLDFDRSSFDAPAPATSFDAPEQNFDVAADTAELDEGLELDLGDDDLDQMLGELGGGDQLSDLEDLTAKAPAASPQWQPAAEPVAASEPTFDLSEEFDLSNAGEDLADTTATEIDVFAGLEQPAASPDFGVAAAEPVTEPVFEPSPAVAPTLEGGDDFDFLSDSDEVATKLDLARAYIDMGDTDGARDILDEVLQEGTDNQKQEASSLLSRIG
jgi:pilus assembly protein FimV